MLALRAERHDVLWARTDCPQWSDVAILERAEWEARTVLTLDKDLWQIAFQRRTPLVRSGVVLFRVHPATVAGIYPLVQKFMASRGPWAGHVTVVTADTIMTRSLSRSQ